MFSHYCPFSLPLSHHASLLFAFVHVVYFFKLLSFWDSGDLLYSCRDSKVCVCVPQVSRQQLIEGIKQCSVCCIIVFFVSALLDVSLCLCLPCSRSVLALSLCASIPTHSFSAAYLPVILLESSIERTRFFFHKYFLYTSHLKENSVSH